MDDIQSSMLSFVVILMEIKLTLNASVRAGPEASVKWKETTRTERKK
jgi:hypothetical protein